MAVVNSSVIVQVQGVPFSYRPVPELELAGYLRPIDWPRIPTSWALFPGTPDTPSNDLMRTFKPPKPDFSLTDVHHHGNLSVECVVEGLPAFRLIIEELWPDNPDDEGAITELFGAASLAWWSEITDEDERRRRTLARMPYYWPDDSEDDRIARDKFLTTKIDCNVEDGVVPWCRWVPERSGYYRLKVAGAWLMHARDSREWRSPAALRTLRRDVMALGDEDREYMRARLGELGCGQGRDVEPECAWSPGVLGLNSDLTDIMSTGPSDVLTPDIDSYDPQRDENELYSLTGDEHRFGGLDLRVTFSEPTAALLFGKYTETQAFGIQVHEVRVHTVTPAN